MIRMAMTHSESWDAFIEGLLTYVQEHRKLPILRIALL